MDGQWSWRLNVLVSSRVAACPTAPASTACSPALASSCSSWADDGLLAAAWAMKLAGHCRSHDDNNPNPPPSEAAA